LKARDQAQRKVQEIAFQLHAQVRSKKPGSIGCCGCSKCRWKIVGFTDCQLRIKRVQLAFVC
jgi:hypothetical protein